MKKIVIFFCITTIVSTACNNQPKTTYTKEDGKTKVTLDVSDLSKDNNEFEQKINELKKLTPLTTQQLKALLPSQLNGLQRSNFEANNMIGFSTAEATYKNNNQSIKLTIFDCAGPSGSSIYSLNYITKLNLQSESEDGYAKSVDLMGKKAMESFEKKEHKYTLVFFTNDRLLINLESTNLSADALKEAAASLQFKIPS